MTNYAGAVIKENDSLLNPNKAPLTAPPRAQLPGSSFSLRAAVVHVVMANRLAAPPGRKERTQ